MKKTIDNNNNKEYIVYINTNQGKLENDETTNKMGIRT